MASHEHGAAPAHSEPGASWGSAHTNTSANQSASPACSSAGTNPPGTAAMSTAVGSVSAPPSRPTLFRKLRALLAAACCGPSPDEPPAVRPAAVKPTATAGAGEAAAGQQAGPSSPIHTQQSHPLRHGALSTTNGTHTTPASCSSGTPSARLAAATGDASGELLARQADTTIMADRGVPAPGRQHHGQGSPAPHFILAPSGDSLASRATGRVAPGVEAHLPSAPASPAQDSDRTASADPSPIAAVSPTAEDRGQPHTQRRVTFTRLLPSEVEVEGTADDVAGANDVDVQGGIQKPAACTPGGPDDDASSRSSDGGEFWDARSWASTSSWGSAGMSEPHGGDNDCPGGGCALPSIASRQAGLSMTPRGVLGRGIPPAAAQTAFNPTHLPPEALLTAPRPHAPHEPGQPLMFIHPNTRWQPMPAVTGLAGWWVKVPERSTPLPMPIDVLLAASWVARKAHESIQGIKITEDEQALNVCARVSVMGAAIIHKERYPKDGSMSHGMLRRDVKPGRVEYRAFYTTDDELVLVVKSFGVSGHLETFGLEVLRLMEGGALLLCDQACYCTKRKRGAIQQFVGRRDARAVH